MSRGKLVRCWGDDFDLRDLLEQQPGGLDLATRDFALLTITGGLVSDFPGLLVFKGGFVLRHAFGVVRFSKDVDATRARPPKHKLDAGEVAESIRAASIGDQVRFDPGRPATDTARSLDFDHVAVAGALISSADVQVEVSYREGVVDPPLRIMIGPPFYEPFAIDVMQPHEIVAEKLRTLAQRSRPTDLADIAVMLGREDVDDLDVARVARTKFELVAGRSGQPDGAHREQPGRAARRLRRHGARRVPGRAGLRRRDGDRLAAHQAADPVVSAAGATASRWPSSACP
jgi:predicted nucleotidyltransferase component of viral defense system